MERDNLEGLSADGKIIFEWILEEILCGSWTALMWLRMWTSGRLLGKH
jgi:hypothetical protein